VAFDGSANVDECVARAFCTVERYGFKSGSHWRLEDLTHTGGNSSWKIFRSGQEWLQVTLPLAGEHNALNATAAAALAAGQGIDPASIAEALSTFRSVKRRLEVRAIAAGVTIIDDFAHHPTAIRETLKALRAAYPGQRLWVVLEPRSNTLRRNVFERELVESLSLADGIVVAGVFKQESIPEPERMHPEKVIAALVRAGHDATFYSTADAIVQGLTPRLKPGDVVAILSNGGFDGIYEKLPKYLTTHQL
jgi:UDP-N-acetylmuramate: L-alanyl-gamma-D-glutamyl-meso-diaminopimelate ligase